MSDSSIDSRYRKENPDLAKYQDERGRVHNDTGYAGGATSTPGERPADKTPEDEGKIKP